MAAAFVQSKSNSGDAGGTTIAVTTTSNVTGGNLLVVGINWSTGNIEDISSLADGLGNTYNPIANNHVRDATAGQWTSVYYAKNITGGACTITATFAASRSFRRIVVHEVSGLDTTAPLDQSTGQNQVSPGTGTDAVTSGSVTTTTNGQYIFATSMDDSGSNNYNAGTGFTGRELSIGASAPMASEDQVQGSAGAIAGTFTVSGNGTHRHINTVATFKAAGVAATAHNLTLMGEGQ